MASVSFQGRHKRTATDFTRKRSLTMPRVIAVIARGVMKSIQREVDEVLSTLFGQSVPDRGVTDGAFCRARMKMKHTAFIELSHEAVDMAYRTMENLEYTAGYRILAIDGSKVNLPETPEIRAHFGPAEKSDGRQGAPQALLSQCYDIQNGLIMDATLSPGDSCERRAAMNHLSRIGEDDIVLFDRGYPAHWFLQGVDATGARFLARAPVDFSAAVRRFVESGKATDLIALEPTDSSRSACREFGLCEAPLTVRAVRIELCTGEVEVLLTNFIDEPFTQELFGALYTMRWPVEEGYKHLKVPLELENFSGRSVESVCQDVHARVFLANMTAVTVLPTREQVAQQTRDRKLEYDLNWTSAVSKVRQAGVLLFLGQDLEAVVHMVQEAASKCLSPVRPGRSNPRKKRSAKRFATNRKHI